MKVVLVVSLLIAFIITSIKQFKNMKGILVVVLLIAFVWVFWMSYEWLVNRGKNNKVEK